MFGAKKKKERKKHEKKRRRRNKERKIHETLSHSEYDFKESDEQGIDVIVGRYCRRCWCSL
jgi:hypothetical protein